MRLVGQESQALGYSRVNIVKKPLNRGALPCFRLCAHHLFFCLIQREFYIPAYTVAELWVIIENANVSL